MPLESARARIAALVVAPAISPARPPRVPWGNGGGRGCVAPRVEPAHATGTRAGLMRQRARNRSAVGAYVATIAYAPLLQYRILFLRTNSRAHSCGPPRAAHNVGAPKAVPHPLRGCTHPLTNLARARRKSANIDSTLFPSHDARPLLLNSPCAPQLVGPDAPPLYVVCPSVCRSIGAN